MQSKSCINMCILRDELLCGEIIMCAINFVDRQRSESDVSFLLPGRSITSRENAPTKCNIRHRRLFRTRNGARNLISRAFFVRMLFEDRSYETWQKKKREKQIRNGTIAVVLDSSCCLLLRCAPICKLILSIELSPSRRIVKQQAFFRDLLLGPLISLYRILRVA